MFDMPANCGHFLHILAKKVTDGNVGETIVFCELLGQSPLARSGGTYTESDQLR